MTTVSPVIDRLLAATNDHDIDRLVDCFAADYVNITPAHPARGFTGREQVRRNWTAIFGGVSNIQARILASASAGDEIWTEWEMTGTRRDGAAHAMAGVVVFRVVDDRIATARFYLEPVESTSGDVDAAINRAVGTAP